MGGHVGSMTGAPLAPLEAAVWPHAPANITLSKSSLVSSVSGSWENMQSSPLMQFPVVWYNLQGKSRSHGTLRQKQRLLEPTRGQNPTPFVLEMKTWKPR